MYSVKKLNFDEAEKVWLTSPNANIYNNPFFLIKFKNIKFYGIFKGDEILCCWPLYIKGKKTLVPDLFYYFGPFWSKKINTIPDHSWLSYSTKIYETCLNKLTKHFNKIDFELHYTLRDVRVFDWWNYNKENLRFKIIPRYTAIVDGLNKKTENQIINDYRYVRRYELKRFAKYTNDIISSKIDFKDILNLYYELIKINEKDKKLLENNLKTIYDLKNTNLCQLLGYRCKKTNKIVSISILLFDNNSSHLVLNIADNNWKKKGIVSWATHNAIIFTKKRNLDIFDFNGANSPQRGDHKHSFGSKTRLYFNLKYENN